MEKLELFVSEGGDALLSESTLDLENLVEVLSENVTAEKENLEVMKEEVQKLKADVEKSTSERNLYLSRSSEVVDLESALVEESRTQKDIEKVSQMLEHANIASRITHSEQTDVDQLQQLETKSKATLASLEERERQLRAEEERLNQQLEAAQASLANVRELQRAAEEELRALQQECSSGCSVASPAETETDRLVDACLERLGMLQRLTKKMK
ncbi:uncharacterized protein LOC144822129 isoform X2 [Lissotriton helveticus]